MSFRVPGKYRETRGSHASTPGDGNNGVFYLPAQKGFQGTLIIMCLASDGLGWEHVSVSLLRKSRRRIVVSVRRTPTWEEMCHVKSSFWEADDVVLQYHPPESVYVNCHPYCLHLWRITETNVRVPDPYLVGPRVRET